MQEDLLGRAAAGAGAAGVRAPAGPVYGQFSNLHILIYIYIYIYICTVLYCAVLYYTTLCDTILYCTTPSPPTKSFPTKSPRVELSGRPLIESYAHDNSHP